MPFLLNTGPVALLAATSVKHAPKVRGRIARSRRTNRSIIGRLEITCRHNGPVALRVKTAFRIPSGVSSHASADSTESVYSLPSNLSGICGATDGLRV